MPVARVAASSSSLARPLEDGAKAADLALKAFEALRRKME